MYVRIDLGLGKYSLIDKEFEFLNEYMWHECKTSGYVIRTDNKNKKIIYMHKEVLKSNNQVDHINCNKLDNRYSNLRQCTPSQNSRNYGSKKGTSKYKGVSLYKPTNKWLAQIYAEGRKINLGYYISEELAAEAYDKACIKYHGEFGRHNSTKDEKVVFEEYPILPRCKRTFSHITYEVVGDDGSYFGTIKECADYFKVKTNTVVKWVSDARTVRGVKYKYGKKLNIKKFI